MFCRWNSGHVMVNKRRAASIALAGVRLYGSGRILFTHLLIGLSYVAPRRIIHDEGDPIFAVTARLDTVCSGRNATQRILCFKLSVVGADGERASCLAHLHAERVGIKEIKNNYSN
jgi:hypothetical protein